MDATECERAEHQEEQRWHYGRVGKSRQDERLFE